MTARVLPDSLGATASVDPLEIGLPRTGCSHPVRVTADGNLYLQSTNTNLLPGPVGTPYDEVVQ